MRPIDSERTAMLKKEGLVLALYVTTSIAIVAHATVEIYATFRRDKPMNDQIKEAKKND
jgi:hypothetical protein